MEAVSVEPFSEHTSVLLSYHINSSDPVELFPPLGNCPKAFLRRGDAIVPRISQPVAASGGSVQPLILKLFTLKATTAAIPPAIKDLPRLSATNQLHKADHNPKPSRAMKTSSTGIPAIAASSR